MKVMYTNANCLSDKHSELRGRIDIVRLDVIGITEIWQKEEFELKGYQQVRKDRMVGQRGGGVMILVKDYWKIEECRELNQVEIEDCIWCKIKISRYASFTDWLVLS